jgi:ATP-dependent exoDNAse (exonuclease V) beta subunit
MMRDPALDLERLATNLLRDEERDDADLPEILRLARAVEQSDLWRQALAADQRLVEVPFAIEVDATLSEAGHPDPAERERDLQNDAPVIPSAARDLLNINGREAPSIPSNPKSETRNPKLIRGTIDLIFKDRDGTWLLIDYKSDATANRLDTLVAFYAPQVRAYATLWQQMTNEPVRAGLFFIDGARTEWIDP